MTLPIFDEMLKMSESELSELLAKEAEEVILSADKERQPRLRAIFNGCVLRSQAAKSPHLRMVSAYDRMWSSYENLNCELQKLKDGLNDQ